MYPEDCLGRLLVVSDEFGQMYPEFRDTPVLLWEIVSKEGDPRFPWLKMPQDELTYKLVFFANGDKHTIPGIVGKSFKHWFTVIEHDAI